MSPTTISWGSTKGTRILWGLLLLVALAALCAGQSGGLAAGRSATSPPTSMQIPPQPVTPDDDEDEDVPTRLGERAPPQRPEAGAPREAPVGPLPFSETWKTSLGGAPAAAPVVGAAVYVALRTGRVVALASDSGKVVWSAAIHVERAPLLAANALVVVTADTLEVLDLQSGEPTSRIPLPSRSVSAPAASGGRIYASLESGEAIAFDPAGGPLWRQMLPVAASLAPEPAGTRVYVAVGDGRIVALDAVTGMEIWQQRLGGEITGVQVDGDRLFLGSRDNFFYCLDAVSGAIKWRWRTGADLIGSSIADEHRVYFTSLDNVLRALDRGHGAQRWKRPLPTRPLGGPLLVGDSVLVSGVAPVLLAFSKETGKPAGRLALDAELAFAAVAAPGTAPGAEWLVLVTRDGGARRLTRKPPENVPAAPTASVQKQ